MFLFGVLFVGVLVWVFVFSKLFLFLIIKDFGCF